MPATPTTLVRTVLTTTLQATLYTAPTPSRIVVKQLVLSNLTGSAVGSLEYRHAGVSVVYGRTLQAYEVLILDLSQVLTDGQVIAGSAGTASAVAIHVAGLVIT